MVEPPAGAQTANELSQQEKRGKLIYLKGESAAGEIQVVLGNTDLALPASSFPCANCHGLNGEGSKEGGLEPPSITWASLSSPHRSALTGRERGPYTDETVARAITTNVGPAGFKLHPGMPRFRLSTDQLADLIAYLKKLGKAVDVDPGLSEDTIRVGAALPMTGRLADVGEDVKLTLEAYFAHINSRSGIYGRKLELVVEDSRGEPAATLEATRRLVEEDRVFALVGTFEPGNVESTNEYVAEKEVPLVGPVTLSPRLAALPNRYVFYLLPGFKDQARVLVDFAGRRIGDKKARLSVIYNDDAFAKDALAGMKAQAKLLSLEVLVEERFDNGHFSATSSLERLLANRPDYVFFFGGGAEFLSLAREMQKKKLKVALLSSVVMIGGAAFDLPPTVANQTFLSYPTPLPNQEGFAEFLSVMQQSGVRLRHSGFQRAAYAAARVFVEAAKAGGRRLNRSEIVSALEQMRDFETGVMPPLTFGPNIRIGAAGAYIVGIDLWGRQYAPLSGWLLPTDTPQQSRTPPLVPPIANPQSKRDGSL
jgi:ABC-type branched-subunit amino acid transport system substrate-binding protein